MALSQGEIAGIAIGCVVFFIICHIPICIYFYKFVKWVIRRNKKIDLPDIDLDWEVYSPKNVTEGSKVPELKDITIKKKIGEGGFGEVFLGVWNDTKVALKKLKADDVEEFKREAGTLFTVIHPNCVQFLGIYHDESTSSFYIVLEYISQGNCLQLLRKRQNLTVTELFQMAMSTSKGMAYLESQNIVHSDLACRNLLVSVVNGRYKLKVCDFGLSQKSDESTIQKLPVRWCAPELFGGGKTTTKSDVWAFGIVLYELFTLGSIPYKELKNAEVVKSVTRGSRLDKPESCPEELYALMLRCWSLNPAERPSFVEISKELRAISKLKKIDNIDRTESVFSDESETYELTPALSNSSNEGDVIDKVTTYSNFATHGKYANSSADTGASAEVEDNYMFVDSRDVATL